MKCVACKQADTQPGFTTVPLERGESIFVVKDVPSHICPYCGEDYVDEKMGAELLNSSEDLSQAGIQVDVRKYAAGGARR